MSPRRSPNLTHLRRPGRSGQPQAAGSRTRQSSVRADPGRPGPAPAAHRRSRATDSALRFGDPRVMALFQALTGFTHLPRGFRNRDLRPHVAALLGRPYSAAQMTYDLRRLRLKGLIHRIPTTHRYTATSYGLKVAFFYTSSICASSGHSGRPCFRDDRLPRPFAPPSTTRRRNPETPRGGRSCRLKNLLQPLRSHP